MANRKHVEKAGKLVKRLAERPEQPAGVDEIAEAVAALYETAQHHEMRLEMIEKACRQLARNAK